MKKTDIALIILIAAISILLSFWIFGMIFEDPGEKFEKIEYVTGISSALDPPDIEVFNTYANNPTAEVYMGECGPTEKWDEEKMKCVPKDGGEEPENPDEPEEPEEPENPDNPENPENPDNPNGN